MTKEAKTKKVTITLTKSVQERAREISVEVLGKTNISGLFSYWVVNYKKKGATREAV
jgi:hypothetical protein